LNDSTRLNVNNLMCDLSSECEEFSLLLFIALKTLMHSPVHYCFTIQVINTCMLCCNHWVVSSTDDFKADHAETDLNILDAKKTV